ncbi:MAG: YoaK family protein [Acidimicrobiales bacterium]
MGANGGPRRRGPVVAGGGDRVQEEEKSWLAVALGWVAGFVDGVGYITLFHLFTAHMSGNSVGLGVDIARGFYLDALHRVTPIFVYVVAVAVGAVVIELGYRREVRSSAAVVMVMEGFALLAVILVGSGQLIGLQLDTGTGGVYYLLAALLAGAMGLQSATLRRVGGSTVRTNFVTGILTNLAESVVVVLFSRSDPPGRSRALRRVGLLGGIWIVYMVGAVSGGLLDQVWQLRSLALPLAVLAVVIAVDVVRPFKPTLPSPGSTGQAD